MLSTSQIERYCRNCAEKRAYHNSAQNTRNSRPYQATETRTSCYCHSRGTGAQPHISRWRHRNAPPAQPSADCGT
jgi:hypothetical protein